MQQESPFNSQWAFGINNNDKEILETANYFEEKENWTNKEAITQKEK